MPWNEPDSKNRLDEVHLLKDEKKHYVWTLLNEDQLKKQQVENIFTASGTMESAYRIHIPEKRKIVQIFIQDSNYN